MTDEEQIIIDGINVTNCNHIIAYDPPPEQGTWGGAIHKGACKIYSKDCKYNPDCDYKQLARKTQEYEELRVAYNKAQDILGRVNNAYEIKSYSLQESIKECEELKKYIQEREVWGDTCEFCKHNDKENCHQNIILDNLKTIDRYRNALEEIEEYCRQNKHAGWVDIDGILDIINKVKEDIND